MVSSEGTQIETFSDVGFALCVQRRVRASDTYCGRVDRRLFYVQGCVEPLVPLPSRSVHRLAEDKVLPTALFSATNEAAALTGSFHLVAYDFDTRQLTLIVDRLASRPVFLYRDQRGLILASDIRAILGIPGVDCSLDVESLAQFVRIQAILGDRTLYRGIRTVMPGTILRARVQECRLEAETYWTLAALPPFSDDAEAVPSLAFALQKAGERVVRGCQRGGVLLSGGLDSRLVLSLAKVGTDAVDAFTFGPALTDEGRVARSVAQALNVPWHLVTQTPADYWEQLGAVLPVLQGLYSAAHTHPFKTARHMAECGIDTIYHGLELCVAFSGSYLPRETWDISGRTLYTHRLSPLSTLPEVERALLGNLDIQRGDFRRSFLPLALRETWNAAGPQALSLAVSQAAEKWDDPYDWYEKALIYGGFSKFRSYIVASCSRAVARERSLMPDAEAIDAYCRLSVRQRFLGPIYRSSFRRINPAVAQIPYANTGVSPFAPPLVQAVAWQFRQFGRANRERLRRLLDTAGLGILRQEFYGSYSPPHELVEPLRAGSDPVTLSVRRALTDGLLAQSGLIDVPLLRPRLDGGPLTDDNEATTILAWASLAAWLDQYPAKVSV